MTETTETAVIESPVPPLTGGVLANMLLGEDEFLEPVVLLRDLTSEQATAKPLGAPESIAQVLGHMHYWQHRNLSRIEGRHPPYPKSQEEKDATWAVLSPEKWQSLVSQFLSDLDSLMAITESDAEIARGVGDDETVGDRIRWSAVHNAYHFGQIALLRRMLRCWPPAGSEQE